MTDGNEDALQFQILAAFTLGGLDAHTGHAAVVAQYLFQGVIPLDADVVLGQQLVL